MQRLLPALHPKQSCSKPTQQTHWPTHLSKKTLHLIKKPSQAVIKSIQSIEEQGLMPESAPIGKDLEASCRESKASRPGVVFSKVEEGLRQPSACGDLKKSRDS
jgi:hypothetical protein